MERRHCPAFAFFCARRAITPDEDRQHVFTHLTLGFRRSGIHRTRNRYCRLCGSGRICVRGCCATGRCGRQLRARRQRRCPPDAGLFRMQTAERFRVVDVDGAAVHHDLLGAGFQQSFSSGLYSKTSRIRLRADLTRSIPDVDRVRGEALAETLQSSHRAARSAS